MFFQGNGEGKGRRKGENERMVDFERCFFFKAFQKKKKKKCFFCMFFLSFFLVKFKKYARKKC